MMPWQSFDSDLYLDLLFPCNFAQLWNGTNYGINIPLQNLSFQLGGSDLLQLLGVCGWRKFLAKCSEIHIFWWFFRRFWFHSSLWLIIITYYNTIVQIQNTKDHYCSGNTTYLFTASQPYTALRFNGFRHAPFYYSCKETRRNDVRTTWRYKYYRGVPTSTITSQVCSVCYLVYSCGYNGL